MISTIVASTVLSPLAFQAKSSVYYLAFNASGPKQAESVYVSKLDPPPIGFLPVTRIDPDTSLPRVEPDWKTPYGTFTLHITRALPNAMLQLMHAANQGLYRPMRMQLFETDGNGNQLSVQTFGAFSSRMTLISESNPTRIRSTLLRLDIRKFLEVPSPGVIV
jgi:hypothetical protein